MGKFKEQPNKASTKKFNFVFETDALGVMIDKSMVSIKGFVDQRLSGTIQRPDMDGENIIDGVHNDTPIAPNNTTNVAQPAVKEIRYFDSLGGKEGQKRLQLAFKDQFVALVGDNYYSIGVSECDLIALQMYCTGMAEIICELDRALYTYNKFSSVNAIMGRELVEVMGFDYGDLAARKLEYIDLRNQLRELFNSKFYVAHTRAIDKTLYLCSRVFVEESNEKSTVIVFTPEEYNGITSNGNVACCYFNVPANEAGMPKQFTLAKLTGYLQQATTFSNSAWYNNVAPYLHHLYGTDSRNLFKIGEFSDSGKLDLVYNSYLCEVIRNADYFGIPAHTTVQETSTPNPAAALFIGEDINGYIYQGENGTGATKEYQFGAPSCLPIALEYTSPTVYNVVFDRRTADDDRLVNFDEYPVSEDVLTNVMEFKFIVDNTKGKQSGGPEGKNAWYPVLQWSGSIVFEYVKLWTSNDGTLSSPGYDVAYFLGYNGVNTQYTNGTITAMMDMTDPYDVELMFGVEWAGNSACTINKKFIAVHDNSGSWLINYVPTTPHDFDNLGVIPGKLLKNFLFASSYEAYVIPHVPSGKVK